MNNNFPLREFHADLSDLSKSEHNIINTLVEAAHHIGKIYLQQENRAYPGANLYSHDATKAEIEAAAKKDKAILDPYTVVERDDRGKLIAIPYHVKYHKELLAVTKLLHQAASLTDNEAFAKRLEFQADALLEGTYEASDIYWLTMKQYKISLVIGPIERFEDKLFFRKCAYTAIIGVIDQRKTDRAIYLMHAIYDARRSTLAPQEKTNFLDKINLRVDRTILFSGFYARGMFTSGNFPNDVDLMEKYGTEIFFFDTSLGVKFTTQHYPIFQRVFAKSFVNEYSVDVLREGSFRNVLLHELGHSLLRYRHAEDRLKEFFPVIDELSATIYGIKSCAPLLLKDIMREEEIEAIMIMFICRAFTWWLDQKTYPSVEPYARGHAIALNHFLATGAIQESNGISWPNFSKMFIGIQHLSDALERLISIGNYDDAKYFIETYGSMAIFDRFAKTVEPMMLPY